MCPQQGTWNGLAIRISSDIFKMKLFSDVFVSPADSATLRGDRHARQASTRGGAVLVLVL